MKAFVLSGGGNYGAIQAGAIQALFKAGIIPDMIVGVSAGALNGAWIAAHPNMAGVRRLGQIWCGSAPNFFPRLNRLNMLLRLTQGQPSLISNQNLQDFVRLHLAKEFNMGNFKQPRLFIVATQLQSGTIHVFGERPEDCLFDALMASTALPPLYPPWEIKGVNYVDGGLISDLPLRVAVKHGATEIFALHILSENQEISDLGQRNVLQVGTHIIRRLVGHHVTEEIEAFRCRKDICFHLIELKPSQDPGFWNFSVVAAKGLIQDGRRITENYLNTADLSVPWRVRLKQITAKPSFQKYVS